MNIFVLALEVTLCARYYMDVHVSKILLEIAQLLSTTKRVLDPEAAKTIDGSLCYRTKKKKMTKKGHKEILARTGDSRKAFVNSALHEFIRSSRLSHTHHPITKWLQVCRPNWDWAISVGEALHSEWRTRFGHDSSKTHKSFRVIEFLKANPPKSFQIPQNSNIKSKNQMTEFAMAMPDQYKVKGDPIQSYRNYYMSPEKQQLASWKNGKPDWYVVDPKHYGKRRIGNKTLPKLILTTKAITDKKTPKAISLKRKKGADVKIKAPIAAAKGNGKGQGQKNSGARMRTRAKSDL